MLKKIKSIFHCLHKNNWIGEYKYIEDSIQHTFTRIDAEDGYISAKYEITCPICERVDIATKIFSFSNDWFVQVIKDIKKTDKNLDFVEINSMIEAEIKAKNFKGYSK